MRPDTSPPRRFASRQDAAAYLRETPDLGPEDLGDVWENITAALGDNHE